MDNFFGFGGGGQKQKNCECEGDANICHSVSLRGHFSSDNGNTHSWTVPSLNFKTVLPPSGEYKTMTEQPDRFGLRGHLQSIPVGFRVSASLVNRAVTFSGSTPGDQTKPSLIKMMRQEILLKLIKCIFQIYLFIFVYPIFVFKIGGFPAFESNSVNV